MLLLQCRIQDMLIWLFCRQLLYCRVIIIVNFFSCLCVKSWDGREAHWWTLSVPGFQRRREQHYWHRQQNTFTQSVGTACHSIRPNTWSETIRCYVVWAVFAWTITCLFVWWCVSPYHQLLDCQGHECLLYFLVNK